MGQVSDPLAHCLEDGRDCARSHRLTTGSKLEVVHPVGQEVADLELMACRRVTIEVIEGAGDLEFFAPGLPSQASVGLGCANLRGVGLVPFVESSRRSARIASWSSGSAASRVMDVDSVVRSERGIGRR